MQHSTKTKLSLLPTLLLAGLLASCDLQEPLDVPAWSNTLEFPITRDTVAISEILEDQPEIKTQFFNGDSIYAYSQDMVMDGQEVSDQLLLEDMQQHFTQSVDDVTVEGSQITEASGFDAVGVDPIQQLISSEVGTIQLNDIPPSQTQPFQLNEIVPEVDSIPDGNAVIPESDLVPVRKPFTFDDFQSATFSGGSLNITILNDMVIALGNPITIQLQEDTGTDTVDISGASVTWVDPIPTSSNATETMDLTGLTLPGNILVEISGHSIGSNGSPVTINDAARTSSFVVEIAGTNLEVVSAEAKIPSQTINESGAITLAASENKVQRAEIASGTLAIDIDNGMAVDATLNLTIESLETPGGSSFNQLINLDANTNSQNPFDITGHFMIMDLDTQEVRYSYEIITLDTDPNFVTLNSTDNVDVTIALYGTDTGEQITFSEITGIIEPQEVHQNGEIDVSSDSKILRADISEGVITIDIDNQINKPGFAGLPKIVLTIPEIQDAASNPFTDSLTLQPGNVNTLPIDLAGRFLIFPDTATQVLTYTTQVTTPSGEVGRYGLNDSIFVNIDVGNLSFTSVTGYFNQDALVDESTIALSAGTKVLQAVFRTGEISLTITNGIGVEANVNFALDEFKRRSDGASFAQDFSIASGTAPQSFGPFSLEEYNLEMPDAQPGVPQEIHYSSNIAIPSDNEMTLTFGDSLQVDVDITGLTLQSVTGIIEPDTLEIEPTEQSIELPDLVKDMQFEEVNILIDFDTGLTIPINLALDLTASDSLGNTESISVSQNITENDSVYIEGAEALINLHPNSIVASGSAIVGDGVTAGTVAYGDTIGSTMHINVPLSLIIDNPDPIEPDMTTLESPMPTDGSFTLEGITLFALVKNEFDFGAKVNVLVSEDSLAFDSTAQAQNTAPVPDTLMSVQLSPEDLNSPTGTELLEIALSNDKINLLERDNFLQTQIQLLGQEDEMGNPLPSRFLSTDTLTVRTWGSIRYQLDPEGGAQ